MKEDFEIKVLGMATPKGDYPGEFSPTVQKIILEQIEGYSSILHLFSGSSLIGTRRIDIEHSNATDNIDVCSFLKKDVNFWHITILDPPYAIERKKQKLLGYGNFGHIGGNVALQRALNEWAPFHTYRILWLDYCAPLINGFKRVILWILLPGGFKHVRILSLLENKNGFSIKKIDLMDWIKPEEVITA